MRRFLISLLIAFPWLNPYAPGPSPTVGPWLITLACFAVLMALVVNNQSNLFSTNSTNGNLAHAYLQPTALAWLAAGLISAVIGLLQYFGIAGVFGPWVNQSSSGEAFANLRQRNQFASLTNMALAALLWLAVQVRSRETAVKYGHIGLLFAAAILLAVGNAISSSRTGLFQLLLLCGLYALWGGLRSSTTRRLLVCAVLTYGVAMFAMPYLAGLDGASYGAFARLGKDDACSSRLVLWSNVMHLIAQKPWLGWGWGELDFAHFITQYNGPRFCDILDNAHNLPLHLAVELGVPLALLVCGGFAWWVLRQKPWAEHDATRQMAWTVMAVILLHSMLEYPLWYGPFQIAFVLCPVILWRRQAAAVNEKKAENNVQNVPLAQVNSAQVAIVTIASTAVIAAILYAAWDYHRVSQIYLQPEARHAAYQIDTLAQARKSWLFADQALFAELILTPLTPATALQVYASAGYLLHYSPEPRVVEKLVESAVMLGKDAEALAYLARFKAAFPKEHAAWAKSNSNAL